MVPLYTYQIFISLILGMHHFTMMRPNEVITFSYNEQCWYKALVNIIDRIKFLNIEVRSAFDAFSNKLLCNLCHKCRYFGMSLCELHREHIQITKW